MKKIVIGILLLALVLFKLPQASSVAYALEIKNRSNENFIFEKVKSGVVTILGASFGSGFFIDHNGLILTNYHVVKDQEGTLRIRFIDGTVIKADVITTSPENDLAVIRVNMKALKYKPYVFTITNQNEVYIGERVVSIGNPIDFLVFDKTLTQGVVSKVDSKIIYHDVALNGGNSGGPLIDLDGNVIGINTFVRSDRGQPLGGAIYINSASKIIDSARKKIATTAPPSDQVYPDIPAIPYKHSIMNTVFTSEKDLNKITSIWKTTKPYYYINGKNFDIFMTTPLLRYKSTLKSDPKRVEEIRKNITNNNNSAKFDIAGDYEASYITVMIAPKPRLTAGSTAKLCALTLVGACGAGPIVVLLPTWNVKCKYSFKSIDLKNKDNKTLLSFSEGKLPLDNYSCGKVLYKTGMRYNVTNKNIYYAVLSYDYKYFDSKEEIYFEIVCSDGKKIDKVIIPEKIKTKVVNDFKPYKDYIDASQEPN